MQRFLHRFAFIAILTSIFISAHSLIPSIDYPLWKILSAFEINVGMTPFTTDMTFLSEAGSSPQGYHAEYDIAVKASGKDILISGRQMGFYTLKLPVLLLAEIYPSDASQAGLVRSICRSLRWTVGKDVSSWAITDHGQIIGRRWSCRH